MFKIARKFATECVLLSHHRKVETPYVRPSQPPELLSYTKKRGADMRYIILQKAEVVC